MRFGPFLLLIVTVMCLAAVTILLASFSGALAVLPALASVGLVLSVLIRRAQ